jgi:hypothetical protein
MEIGFTNIRGPCHVNRAIMKADVIVVGGGHAGCEGGRGGCPIGADTIL